MKYLCLIYIEERRMSVLPDAEWRGLMDDCQRHKHALCERSAFLGSAALEGVETATTLRIRNGRIAITDGPFAETKEQLAGYFLIEADGLHDALHMAAGIPGARLGSVEVRPVRELEHLGAAAAEYRAAVTAG